MLIDEFYLALTRATLMLGTPLDVANAIGVEPLQIYKWMAELERPSEEERQDLQGKLARALIYRTQQTELARLPFHSARDKSSDRRK